MNKSKWQRMAMIAAVLGSGYGWGCNQAFADGISEPASRPDPEPAKPQEPTQADLDAIARAEAKRQRKATKRMKAAA